jgi:hypothetical protein
MELISGRKAVVDMFSDEMVSANGSWTVTWEKRRLRNGAESYVYDLISLQMKLFGSPRALRVRSSSANVLFGWKREPPATILVDAVSGRDHSLSIFESGKGYARPGV